MYQALFRNRLIRECGIIVGTAFLLFIPFSGKPLHIDSPVTVYVAKQFIRNPLNPPLGHFGRLLSVWNATGLPTTSVFHATPHPPLVSWYAAGIIHLFGDSERVVNWSFFPFFAGTLLFFYALSKLVGIRRRLSGTLLFAVSPALLINAQNVMYDVPLTLFCIGGFFWMFRNRGISDSLFAGLFAGCACLIKFTGGTLLIAGALYYLLMKQWRHLLVFLLVAGTLNTLWVVHNLLLFDAWQLTKNGHAHFLAGDIRYRYERMVSYLGAGVLFPLFPLYLWWQSKKFRKTGICIGLATLAWSSLLFAVLHDSFPSALFFWCCSFAGSTLIAWFFGTFFSCRRPAQPDANDTNRWNRCTRAAPLALHTALQIIGGGFLTLYAVRYTLPFVFILFLFMLVMMESVFSPRKQRVFSSIAGAISLLLSLALSFGDLQIVNAERRIAEDCRTRYPATPIFYHGRLGYLYYMDKIGAHSISDTLQQPSPGAIAVENCFYSDDQKFIDRFRSRLTLIDSACYPLPPFRTIGGRAGFYGNDRLPYSIDCSGSPRVFRMYKFTK
jgi:4-amino-4-deoxy-L-arabinose transferase-like glycosyltransferase